LENQRTLGQEARQIRLLLVDDDRLVLGTLAPALRSQGYFVQIASNGEAALASVASLPIDLALLDIRLPGMSGIELGQRLLSDHQVPFVFLSAFNDRDTVERAIAQGALGFVVKPVDIIQLVPALSAALARARDLRLLSDLKAQLETALKGDRNINVAIGIVMEHLKLDRDEAFRRIRTLARNQGKTIESVALAFVEGNGDFNGLNR